ncbi:hypothetical protein MLD38_013089 [Melastoma candidum]|uniref:Uncharacterized protein n=1 Tax=Melastoma candidum TaxID=119954 RepID=A0ACB9R914_9MYRT|nr:hypothetical protein MLD38_013089 [Melastoma candidum]
MMNAVAIALLVASLASAGVWSPPPPSTERSNDDVIVKGGHRVVVVEYDKDGNPNTKVSISPDHDVLHHEPPVDSGNPSEEGGGHHRPKELICDAFGKCRHKIASAFGRAKEEAAEGVHDAEEAAREAKDSVEEKIGKVKEELLHKTHEAMEGVRSKVDSTKDAAKDAARSVKEGVSESAESAGESVKETAREVKAAAESVRSRAMRMKDFGDRHLMKHLGLDALSGLLNLVGFATAYGMCVWVTFVSSYVLASVLPRHMFGQVQSKIYPVYFRGMVCCVSATLMGHLLSRRKLLATSHPEALQAYNLLTAILTVLVNMLYMEPSATKVMMEKMKVEKEEGRGRDLGPETRKGTGGPPAAETEEEEEEEVRERVRRLNCRLRKLNSYSSMLNVMSLMSLTWHLVYLAQRLSMTC